MFALGFEQASRAEEGEIVRLRSPAGENNFAGLRAEKNRRAVARVVQQRAGLAPDVMRTAGSSGVVAL